MAHPLIIAHLSDLHLGFRAYGRVERGADVRERDVAFAFQRTVQEILLLRPDVVVVAGDVFDRPDPPAGAVVALARGLELLRGTLPQTLVLMVAGPRDTPRREGDPGALAVLDTFSNVEAATGLTRSLLIDRLDLHACLIPHRSVVGDPPAVPEPDPRRRWNLLVVHALEGGSEDGSAVPVDPGEWDYVALGGEHRRRALMPRVGYPGALERVDLDPWEEATDEKGFLTVDLESGTVTFHPIPGRAVAALAPIRVVQGDADRIRRRVREVTEEVPGGLDGKIVRLTLQGAVPSDLLALQGEPLRELRERSLHLAVEAGRPLLPPTDLWLATDGARVLREAVASELDREGALSRAAIEVCDRWITGDGNGPARIGALEALDGEVPGFGRVSTSVPAGLTGVFGGGGGARRAILELFAAGGLPEAAGEEAPMTEAIRGLWRGGEVETLAGSLRQAILAVAESRGLARIDRALRHAGVPELRTEVEWREGSQGRGAVHLDPVQVAAELQTAERELRDLRADAVEADGDVEVATMDWLRERQDAETTLHAYRDRAREVRARLRKIEAAGPEAPCPTCGRVLSSHHAEVVAELREEWETIVQDGSWWRSRWSQLELKPERLRDLEGTSLRLHAALEAGSERVEILRARLAEFEVGSGRRSEETRGWSAEEGVVVDALRRLRAARLARAEDMVLDRGSRFVCRLSGGRILALTRAGERTQLQGMSGPLKPLSEEDLALGRIAIRLAAASLVAGEGRVLASLPIEEPFDRLDEEASIRALVLLRALLPEIPRIIVFTRGDPLDARPELFDYLLEVRDEGAPGPLVRPVPAGPGRVRLRSASLAP